MDYILTLLSEYGLWVVFFGMIVEGTVVIILSGVLCHMGVLPCGETFVVAILGAIVGDQMWFYIGRNYAQKFLSKFPSIEKQINTLQEKVQSKADILAVTSRFVYSGAIAFPLVLGTHNYSHKRFTVLDSVGVSFACLAGLSIGYFLSNSFQKVLGDINHFEHMLLFVIIVVVAIKFYRYNIKKG
jgi:membrane protein DedA with SNARE-associated domain